MDHYNCGQDYLLQSNTNYIYNLFVSEKQNEIRRKLLVLERINNNKINRKKIIKLP